MKTHTLLLTLGLLMVGPPVEAEPTTPGTTDTTQATKKKRRKGKRRPKKVDKAPEAEATPKSPKGEGAAGPSLRRSNRMEFDARLVKGERAAGAVYLFHRTPRPLPPLLHPKREVLNRIVWPVLRRPADPEPAKKE